MILTAGFLYLIYWLYLNALSIMTPHQTPNNIFYDVLYGLCSRIILDFWLQCPHYASIWFGGWPVSNKYVPTCAIIVSFFINAHVVHYCYETEGSPFCFAFKLVFKHLGSIFAAAFINSFLLVPSVIYDSIRNCGDAKFQKVNCCNSLFDIVRSDALSMVILTGTPYCNAAKYC